MSSTILFRFQSQKKNDAITFSGLMIRLLDLKRAIVDKKQLARGHLDFDLAVSNAQTNEAYTDDNMMIHKNTSVVVKRVPAPGNNGLLARLASGKAKYGGSRAPKPIEVPAREIAAPAPSDPRLKKKPAPTPTPPTPPPAAPAAAVDGAENLNVLLANMRDQVNFSPRR